MTDNEIIKALKCCVKAQTLGDCRKLRCPASTLYGCQFYLRTDNDYENAMYTEIMKDALDLINHQKAEVERLKENNEALNSAVSSALDIVNSNYQNGRADAIKEFVERLKANEREHCQWCNHSNKGSRSEWCDELIDGHCRCLGFSKFESKLDNLVKEMVGKEQ